MPEPWIVLNECAVKAGWCAIAMVAAAAVNMWMMPRRTVGEEPPCPQTWASIMQTFQSSPPLEPLPVKPAPAAFHWQPAKALHQQLRCLLGSSGSLWAALATCLSGCGRWTSIRPGRPWIKNSLVAPNQWTSIRPGRPWIKNSLVAPKSVGSMTTEGQMKPTFLVSLTALQASDAQSPSRCTCQCSQCSVIFDQWGHEPMTRRTFRTSCSHHSRSASAVTVPPIQLGSSLWTAPPDSATPPLSVRAHAMLKGQEATESKPASPASRALRHSLGPIPSK